MTKTNFNIISKKINKIIGKIKYKEKKNKFNIISKLYKKENINNFINLSKSNIIYYNINSLLNNNKMEKEMKILNLDKINFKGNNSIKKETRMKL